MEEEIEMVQTNDRRWEPRAKIPTNLSMRKLNSPVEISMDGAPKIVIHDPPDEIDIVAFEGLIDAAKTIVGAIGRMLGLDGDGDSGGGGDKTVGDVKVIISGDGNTIIINKD